MSSSTCASKPAEKMTSSGRKSSSAGSQDPVTASRSSRPPAPAASGTFSVRSRPYATIYADGVSLGDTPLYKTPLRAGTHHVRAVLPDGRERTFDITVRVGEDTSAGTLEW